MCKLKVDKAKLGTWNHLFLRGRLWRAQNRATICNKLEMWKCLNDKCVSPSFCYRHMNFHWASNHSSLESKCRVPACLSLSGKWGKRLPPTPYFGHSRGTKVVRPCGPNPLHAGQVLPLFSPLSPPFCCLFFIFLTFYFILGVQPSNNVMIIAGTQQSDSAIHDMYPLSSKFPSYPDSLSSTHCHITLSRVSSVYIFLQTRHTDGQEAHEKMFNIANY